MYFITFHLKIILDSDAVVRNAIERCHNPLPSFCNGNILQNYHTLSNTVYGSYTVNTQSISTTTKIPIAGFYGSLSVPLPPTLTHEPLATTNAFSISVMLLFQEQYINGIILYLTIFTQHKSPEIHLGYSMEQYSISFYY